MFSLAEATEEYEDSLAVAVEDMWNEYEEERRHRPEGKIGR